jgi:hypothetical protein
MSLASKCGEKLLQNKQLKAHYKRVKSFPNISKYDKILLEKKVSCNEEKHTHTHTLSLSLSLSLSHLCEISYEEKIRGSS